MIKRLNLFLALFFLAFSSCVFAHAPERPFYVGVSGGYGSADWDGLDAHDNATQLSTPVKADDNGFVWGAFVGYQFNPNFALEAAYHRYAVSELTFSNFNYYNRTQLSTQTASYTLMGKIMTQIVIPQLKGFAGFGAAYIYRKDNIAHKGHVGPAFSVGLSYDATKSINLGLDVEYLSGFGRSVYEPVNDYVPFVYSTNLTLAYRFSLF